VLDVGGHDRVRQCEQFVVVRGDVLDGFPVLRVLRVGLEDYLDVLAVLVPGLSLCRQFVLGRPGRRVESLLVYCPALPERLEVRLVLQHRRLEVVVRPIARVSGGDLVRQCHHPLGQRALLSGRVYRVADRSRLGLEVVHRPDTRPCDRQHGEQEDPDLLSDSRPCQHVPLQTHHQLLWDPGDKRDARYWS
jgi:hypothetical protein